MSTDEIVSDRPATLADYVAILRRRVWLVVALPLIVAVTAYAVATTQSPRYKATAAVYLNLANNAANVVGIYPQIGDPERFVATQGKIARSQVLASRVVRRAGADLSTGSFLSHSSATPEADVDFLDLSVSAENAGDAISLTNIYARQFVRLKNELERGRAAKALEKINRRIRVLRAQGRTDSDDYDNALKLRDTLEIFGSVITRASVSSRAESAVKVRPRPGRNALLGGLLGVVLGFGFAFLAEALDRRTRSEREIEEALGLPLLGRLSRPPRRLRNENKLVMVAEPRNVHAEAFRKLRTNVEFVNFERSARTIVVTSAGPREGKSTMVANLAVALARAGRRVALVDLDLRRPLLYSFFDLDPRPGFTDVIVQRADLAQAMRPIALPGGLGLGDAGNGVWSPEAAGSSNGRSKTDGVLHVLPAGTIPPAADELLESDRVSTLLGTLAEQFDLVLVDAPPLLAVGDAQTLSANVDAMVAVTHYGIHRRQLNEFARQLQNCRATVLGFVLTGVPHGDSYTYGYGYDAHVYADRQEAEQQRENV